MQRRSQFARHFKMTCASWGSKWCRVRQKTKLIMNCTTTSGDCITENRMTKTRLEPKLEHHRRRYASAGPSSNKFGTNTDCELRLRGLTSESPGISIWSTAAHDNPDRSR